MLDAMAFELKKRYGAPTWQNNERSAMTWAREAEEIGLFLQPETNFVVEVHVAVSPAPDANAHSMSRPKPETCESMAVTYPPEDLGSGSVVVR